MAKKKSYVSEKELNIGKKTFTLIKTDAEIVVKDGEKVAYEGSSGGFHKWYAKKIKFRE